MEVRGGAALDDARRFLLESGREELVALFGRTATVETGVLFLVQEIEHAPEDMVWRDREGLHWKPELTRVWSNRAEDADQGVVLMHAHHHDGVVGLSKPDVQTCERILSHLESIVPSQAHGYGVVGRQAITGWFAWQERRSPWRRLKTVSCPIQTWVEEPITRPPAPLAMARQVSALTDRHGWRHRPLP